MWLAGIFRRPDLKPQVQPFSLLDSKNRLQQIQGILQGEVLKASLKKGFLKKYALALRWYFRRESYVRLQWF